MHELSIIHSILETAEQELRRRGEGYTVESIELEIGELAGVEISTVEFLWPAAVGQTVLENAGCSITRMPGTAQCHDCGASFTLQQYFDPCPDCGSHLLHITGGEELRIKSLTLVSREAPADIYQNWN